MTEEKKVILSEEEAMTLQKAILFVRFGPVSEELPLGVIKSLSLLQEKMVESGIHAGVIK
tara:strand:+ start:80 stop:259 length:180 start_codon:yes stop_codon:yes gene_type:complete